MEANISENDTRKKALQGLVQSTRQDIGYLAGLLLSNQG